MSSRHDKMVAGQKDRRRGTQMRLVEAMKMIEQEVEKNGCYRENNGVLNQKETCRRAGVAPGTLKNGHHMELRETVKKWLSSLASSAPSSKKDALKTARQSNAKLESVVRKMSAEVLRLRQETEALEDRLRKYESNVLNLK